jgi:hypothetical protein
MQLNFSTASFQLINQSGYFNRHTLTSLLLIISIRFEYNTLGPSFVIFRQEQMLPFVRVQLGDLSRVKSNGDTTCVNRQAKSLISRFVIFGFASTSTVTGSPFISGEIFHTGDWIPLTYLTYLHGLQRGFDFLLNLSTPFMTQFVWVYLQGL